MGWIGEGSLCIESDVFFYIVLGVHDTYTLSKDSIPIDVKERWKMHLSCICMFMHGMIYAPYLGYVAGSRCAVIFVTTDEGRG